MNSNLFFFDLQRFTTISADPSQITLQRGGTQTVTVTGTASHGGKLTYSLLSHKSLGSLSGRNLTINVPSTASAGDYDLVVRCIETYTEIDDTIGYSVIWENGNNSAFNWGGGHLSHILADIQ